MKTTGTSEIKKILLDRSLKNQITGYLYFHRL